MVWYTRYIGYGIVYKVWCHMVYKVWYHIVRYAEVPYGKVS